MKDNALCMQKTVSCHPYTLGLVSVSFRGHGPEEILRMARAAGLSCIEWGSDVHVPCRDVANLEHIARLQAEYGIACSSYGTYFRLGRHPLDELPDYIRAAKILGTDILRVWAGERCGGDMTKEERAAFFDECRRAAGIAAEHGVILCTECHRGTFTERPEDTLALMQAVNSPHFCTYWQPFQWLDEQGSLEVAKTVVPYTRHVHVFNWQGARKLPLADAVDAWRRYLSVLPAPRTLLLEFMPDDRIESLAAEAHALGEIVGGL